MRTYSLSYLTASSLTPPQAVAVAVQAGYTHVGLRLCPSMYGGNFHRVLEDPQLMRETMACLRDTGVGVFDIEVIRLREDFDASVWLALLEASATLKARGVLVVGDDADRTRLSHSFAQMCEAARPFGLTVDLEFLPWTTVRNAADALGVIEAAGRPANAGLLVDALHWARSGGSAADIEALPRKYLHYAQICDGPGSGTFTPEQMIHTAISERLLPGEGGIDLGSLFRALPADLPLSIEIPHHIRQPQLGALEWARQALAATRKVLEP